jgi:Uma2 family endonuclease
MSTAPAASIVYPESDGAPMADNMKQAEWMVMLFGNLSIVLDCFVGMNNFWFPVEGEPEVRLAPDVYVAFGRPKGYRASYKQWEENDVPVTVVFEIRSPANTEPEMEHKYCFYEEHGVEEYYIYDPDRNYLEVYLRKGTVFRRVWLAHGFVSPRMGIRFDLDGPELAIYRPDGRRFLTFEELDAERVQMLQRATQAEQRADEARHQADEARQRAARLAELSRKARRGQATPDELRELDRLEQEATP